MTLDIKDTDVSDDHILLSEILDDHEITVKKLSLLTGRAGSTIYKYLSGEAGVPMIIWRAVYKETGDTRITALVTGDEPVMLVRLLDPNQKNCEATIGKLLETRVDQIECEKIILDILADGRVDEADRKAIRKYKKAFPEMITAQGQLFEAITGAKKNGNAKN